jgi:hypothetical protein
LLKKIYKLLALLLIGFAGGALSPWVVGWFNGTIEQSQSDAIAIANTYIIFTTLIFVGFTVVLALAGYALTQQFSASKETQEAHLCKELEEKIRSDENIGIKLADAILDNPDVKRHLDGKIGSKLKELIEERLEGCQTTAAKASQEAAAITALSRQINGREEKDNE